jgi:type II secretory pathway pseudopilin PulG
MIRPGKLHRAGWTLIELMVSATIAIMIVLAVSLVFNKAARTISDGRAAIELSGNLRAAAHQLREDLKGVTCPTLPLVDPGDGLGYFEYIEGPGRDWDADADGIADVLQAGADTTLGDIDDVLIFTAFARDRPFQGQVLGDPQVLGPGRTLYASNGSPTLNQETVNLVESTHAEIIWWTQWDDVNGNTRRDPGEVTLYRRVLLIRPDIVLNPQLAVSQNGPISDVSANTLSNRVNSLGSATIRENRSLHDGVGTSFPFPLSRAELWLMTDRWKNTSPSQTGNTIALHNTIVVLSHVLAFDVKAYDPLAPVKSSNGRALVPGDPGYAAAPVSSVVGRGAYVDLNYAGDPTISWFSGPPDVRSGLWGFFPSLVTPVTPNAVEAVYPAWSTWPTHYERDGLKQENGRGANPATALLPIDSGTNGIDDDGINGVDDAGEWETAPPYNHALRGIEITIRALEPDSHQVRQTTVRISFVPE